MDEKQTIEMLRYALASIWTEIEYNSEPDSGYNCQSIASEALRLTSKFARPKNLTDDGIGLEGWKNSVTRI